ncbi:MAG: GyrI-like domain-containing protein [Anaerolineae bacterium]|nr:MAG: GyrI-like domain-containing protein [Anaerolineae bacterium]
MEKLDLRKELKYLYAPSAKKVEVVDVPELQFAMIDGQIEPGQMPGASPRSRRRSALYGISYRLKFMSKLRADNPVDYKVMGLEGLWWIEEGEFDITQPGNWHWTLLIVQPAHVTPAMFVVAQAELRRKRPNPAIDQLRLAPFHEGLCMQVMHLGPYADEPQTVARMKEFAQAHNYEPAGKHHEIYLGDPLRSAPHQLKTILRQPVRPVEA